MDKSKANEQPEAFQFIRARKYPIKIQEEPDLAAVLIPKSYKSKFNPAKIQKLNSQLQLSLSKSRKYGRPDTTQVNRTHFQIVSEHCPGQLFCLDVSEHNYGSYAFLFTVDNKGTPQLTLLNGAKTAIKTPFHMQKKVGIKINTQKRFNFQEKLMDGRKQGGIGTIIGTQYLRKQKSRQHRRQQKMVMNSQHQQSKRQNQEKYVQDHQKISYNSESQTEYN